MEPNKALAEAFALIENGLTVGDIVIAGVDAEQLTEEERERLHAAARAVGYGLISISNGDLEALPIVFY